MNTTGVLVALAVVLQAISAFSVFNGIFRDDNSWQTKLINKKGFKAPTAAARIAGKRQLFNRVLAVALALSLACDVGALVLTLTDSGSAAKTTTQVVKPTKKK